MMNDKKMNRKMNGKKSLKGSMKKVGFLTMAAVLAVSVSACGKKETEMAGNAEAPATIRIVTSVDAQFQVDNNPVIDAIEKAANVKLEIEVPPINNYLDRLNVIMASGELPDIVFLQETTDSSFYKWADDGLWIPLDEYLPDLPNVTANTTEDQLKAGVVPTSGKLYAFPRPHAENFNGAVIRQDWLDKLGLEMPETIEEFEKVATAFTFEDPDGDGQDNTYGFSMTNVNDNYNYNNLSVFYSAFNLHKSFCPDENGKVTIIQDQPGYYDMMDFFRRMYEKGVLDPEWYTNQGYAETDKFKFGQTGIDSLYIKPVSLFSTDVYTGTKSAFPDSRLGFIYPLKKDENSQSYYETTASTWGGYAISSSCSQIDRVLQFIDWCYSEEGRTLMNIGVQGITYDSFTTTEDGTLAKINYKDDQYENSLKYVSKYFTFITALDGMRLVAVGDSPENQDAYINMETTYRNNVEMAYIPTIQVLTSYSKLMKDNPELGSKLDEACAKYIIGNSTREEFVDYIENTYVPAFADVITEMQDYYDSNLK